MVAVDSKPEDRMLISSFGHFCFLGGKMKIGFFHIVGLIVFVCFFSSASYAQDKDPHSLGGEIPTQQELESLEKEGLLVKIDEVRRIAPVGGLPEAAPPSAVDNSTSGFMPPVASQGSIGSCACFSVTYYYKTYQEAKEHGWSPSKPDKQFSASFVYNQINDGQNKGTSSLTAIGLICEKGCATLANMPYDGVDYTSWPTENAWRNALPYRAEYCAYFPVDSEAGLVSLKQHLATGDLAIIYIIDTENFDAYNGGSGWGFDNGVIFDDRGTSRGNHAVTVVGYDDNKSYNDGTGVRYGAFKLVNSWGTDWGSGGYFYLSYNYVKSKLAWNNAVCMVDKTAYAPVITATFGINRSERGQLDLTVGIGSTSSPLWTKKFFDNLGGNVAIDDSKRIVVDITDGWSSIVYNTPWTYFLQIDDSYSGWETGTIQYFSVDYNASSTAFLRAPCKHC